MRTNVAAAAALLLLPFRVLAAGPPRSELPAPATIPLVRIEVGRDHVLVVEDLDLFRGEWSSGDLDLFVAFGAPGTPRAMDAQLRAGPKDDTSAADGESIRVERSYRRPPRARLLLGPELMAGVILHVPEAVLRRASVGGAAWLRIRTLLDLPARDASGAREVVVRLGTSEGQPDALERIELAPDDQGTRITRARATLCGAEADPHPLAISVAPELAETEPAISPLFAVRRRADALCVRFWTAP